MQTWKRFYATATLLAASAAISLALLSVADNLNGPFDHGWFGTWVSLRVAPDAFSLLFPLTTMLGAVSASRISAKLEGPAERIALPLTAGLISFVLLAYLAPLLQG